LPVVCGCSLVQGTWLTERPLQQHYI